MTKVFVRMAQLLFPGHCISGLLVHLRHVLAGTGPLRWRLAILLILIRAQV